MIQKTLEAAGKLSGDRVGGKKTGKAMHSYLSLIRVKGDIDTDMTRDDLQRITAFVSANGKPDGGKVPRNYPIIPEWEGKLTFLYPDRMKTILSSEKIEDYLDLAGTCIGIGHWRPGAPSKGSYGTFTVKRLKSK